jgi:hypothetical protein
MLISYSHKFIFIHIYKVAGTSIRDALKPYSYDPDVFLPAHVLRKLRLHNLLRHHRLQKLPGHSLAREIKQALPRQVFDEFYKFAFVRNPWDWQVSLFHFPLRDTSHHQHELMKSLGTFDNFIKWRVEQDQKKRLQKDFVVDENGELMVDFIGRMETLNRDFKGICERLGIEYNLPHLNQTPRKDYRSYYTPETAAIIAEVYKKDIEFFGYDFDKLEDLPPILGRTESERFNRPEVAHPRIAISRS